MKLRIMMLAAVFLTAMCIGVSAEDSVMFSFKSEKDGSGYNVQLIADANVLICAGSLEIVYDGSAFDISDLKMSTIFDGTMLQVNENYSDNSAKVTFVSLDELDIDGEVLSFKLTSASDSADTEINLENVLLADINESMIPYSIKKLTVSIIQNKPKPSGGSSGSGTFIPEKPSGNSAPEKAEDEDVTVSFSDIAEYEWADEQILFLAGKKIINGIGGGLFAPGANIKRGDFVCMLMRMLGVEEQPSAEFDDVSRDSYWYSAIMTARSLGIANGYQNRFNPSDSITRQDMFTLVCRAFDIKTNSDDVSYTDKDLISDYAINSIAALSSLGIVQGDAGHIDPLNNATRAETAVMLYNIYNFIQTEEKTND